MSDLLDFIDARLAEEEEEAQFVASFNRTDTWTYDDGVERARRDSEQRFGGRVQVAVHESVRGPHTHIDFSGQWPAITREFQFIARYDPARVLRQIEATRAALEPCRKTLDFDLGWEYTDTPDLANDVVMGIAATWSDHPDYPL